MVSMINIPVNHTEILYRHELIHQQTTVFFLTFNSLALLDVPLSLYYNTHQIPTPKRFLDCLVAVFAETLEARCQVENEDVVSWSSADRRCSNYIWVIDNFIAY